MNFPLLRILTSVAFATAVASFSYALAALPAYLPPSTGHRGLKRRLALARGDGFARIEWLTRLLASWVAPLPLAEQRTSVEIWLRQSGYFLGITADEFMGLTVISGVGFGLVGAGVYGLMPIPGAWVVLITILAFFFPYLSVQSEIRRRVQDVTEGLPGAIDLMALCMGAGLDFVGAMRFVIAESQSEEDVVREEFARVLSALEIGYTRIRAMRELGERLPADSVQDFVSAVVQAEEKGNPLAEVLEVQAKLLRSRRTVSAENAAARAGVLMALPLMMLLLSCLVLFLAPMLTGGLKF